MARWPAERREATAVSLNEIANALDDAHPARNARRTRSSTARE
jgi:hypothetical protein